MAEGTFLTICRVASRPFIPGMATSMTTTSGRVFLASATACTAVLRFANHRHVPLGLQQGAQPLAHHGVIVHQQHGNLLHTKSVVARGHRPGDCCAASSITDLGPLSRTNCQPTQAPDLQRRELVLMPDCAYSCRVKPRLFPSSACSLIAICLLLAFARPQRKRNRFVCATESSPPRHPQPGASRAKSALAAAASVGTFPGPVEVPAARAGRREFAFSGVDLLHYVPGDAFVSAPQRR